MTRNDDLTPLPSLVLCLLLLFSFQPAFGQSTDSFKDRMEVKLRRTSNIYLEAQSHREAADGQVSDTMNLTFAYRYPKQFLQWVRSPVKDREQVLIAREDTVVLSYPHIQVLQRRQVDKKTMIRTVARKVPFAGLFVGIASEQVPSDSISIKIKGDDLIAKYKPGTRRGNLKWIKARFTKENLRPKSFIIQNESYRHFVEVTDYQEEERFPIFIEKALNNLETTFIEEYQP